MKLRKRSVERKARIEIIPLIDIMFFLLATFVMVSTAMIKNKAISVNLPTASTGTKEERKEYASLSVTSDGSFYFDKNKLTLEQLDLALQQFKATTTDPKVFINGDEKASVGDLVTALDSVKKVGITKIALETKVKS